MEATAAKAWQVQKVWSAWCGRGCRGMGGPARQREARQALSSPPYLPVAPTQATANSQMEEKTPPRGSKISGEGTDAGPCTLVCWGQAAPRPMNSQCQTSGGLRRRPWRELYLQQHVFLSEPPNCWQNCHSRPFPACALFIHCGCIPSVPRDGTVGRMPPCRWR